MTNEEVIRTSHIDREAWEPCPECGPNRLIMGDKYCCECGRPLTEEAWAKLEKRVMGGYGVKCMIDNFEVNYPCSSACRLYGDCIAAFLEARKRNVRTNADRIRAMSDEELADMFAEFAEENPSDDANAWYEWLTKLAEEE